MADKPLSEKEVIEKILRVVEPFEKTAGGDNLYLENNLIFAIKWCLDKRNEQWKEAVEKLKEFINDQIEKGDWYKYYTKNKDLYKAINEIFGFVEDKE